MDSVSPCGSDGHDGIGQDLVLDLQTPLQDVGEFEMGVDQRNVGSGE